MPSRPVQISLDSELLARIDRDPQARKEGRSALIRRAVELYLAAKHRREVDAQLVKAFAGQADEMLDDVEQLLEAQAWPED